VEARSIFCIIEEMIEAKKTKEEKEKIRAREDNCQAGDDLKIWDTNPFTSKPAGLQH
jgi:hypothetical protein